MNKIILKELDKYLGGMIDVNKAPIPNKKTYLLEHVNREDMTYDTVKAIRIVAINPRDMYLYGSYTYKAQPYPGDIDAFEKIEVCPKGCSRDEGVDIIVKLIQNMIRKALDVPGVYLGDVKICVNNQIWEYFKKDNWGHLSYNDKNNKFSVRDVFDKGVRTRSKAVYDQGSDTTLEELRKREDPNLEGDWDAKQNLKELNEMKYKNLITMESYKEIKKFLTPHITPEKFIELCDVIRSIVILRWTKEEIYQGYKIVVGNRKIFLHEAIKQCDREFDKERHKFVSAGTSMIKPDFWLKVNDKFLEMSDLLMFTFVNEDDKLENISDYTFLEPGDTAESLKKEIIKTLKGDMAKYYYSPLKKHHNPIKYAKRLFSLALLNKDKKTADKLAYLWKSEFNLMSQIKAEIDLVINMLEKLKEPPLRDLKHQIDQLKFRLSHVINNNIPPWIIKNINKIANPQTTPKEMIKLLEPIYDHLKAEIDTGTLAYLKKADLWPAPHKYLDPNYFEIII